MFDWIDDLNRFLHERSLKKKLNKRIKIVKECDYYVSRHYAYNLKTLQRYDFEDNLLTDLKIEDIAYKNRYEIDSIKIEGNRTLSSTSIYAVNEEQYDRLIGSSVKCNCEIGSGAPEIKAGEFHSNTVVFSEIFGEDYELKRSDSNIEYYILSSKDKSFQNKLHMRGRQYRQKACLKCDTCLDEKKDLIKVFQYWIDKWEEKVKEQKRIEEICS